jgi:hypothetical protein
MKFCWYVYTRTFCEVRKHGLLMFWRLLFIYLHCTEKVQPMLRIKHDAALSERQPD